MARKLRRSKRKKWPRKPSEGFAPKARTAGKLKMSAEQQLNEIKAVLAAFDWERDDRQYALEAIEEIANRTPES